MTPSSPTSRQARLIDGPVARTLAALTGPMLIGILTMISFNLVDTFFVGRLGKVELAAMSFTFPVVLMLGSLTQGIGIGASVVISRAIGEGNGRKTRRYTTDSLILALVITAIASAIGLLTINPVFQVLGAETRVFFLLSSAIPERLRLFANVIPHIRAYMQVWYLGMVAVVVPMVGNAAIRATGDTKTPAMIMLIAVMVNGILDPILIFGLGGFDGLGIRGAAIATALARTTTLFAAIYVLHYRERMIDFTRPVLGNMLDSWKRVLFIGLPAAFAQMLTPISQGIVTGMVAAYSTEAVAAFGVASRIEVFGLTLVMALGATLMPFVGQNWGAKRMDRVRLAVRYSQQFAFGWGSMFFLLLALFREPIATVFSDDPTVTSVLATYLLLAPIGYGLQNVLLVTTSTLNALNKPIHATLLMAIRLLFLYLPLAIIGSRWFGLEGIFGALAVASVLTGIGSWWWLRRMLTPPGRDTIIEPAAVPARPASQPADSLGQ